MYAQQLAIPRFSLDSNTQTQVLVTRSGRACGLTMGLGDQLFLDPDQSTGLQLLIPSGWGFPMLGWKVGRSLLAEPSGALASPVRWRASGRVVAVERDLDEGPADHQDWWLAVRVDGSRRALLNFGRLDRRGIDLALRRGLELVESGGLGLALGLGKTQAEARKMARQAMPGRVRLSLLQLESPTKPSPVVGIPVRRMAPAPLSRHQCMQLRLFGDSRRGDVAIR